MWAGSPNAHLHTVGRPLEVSTSMTFKRPRSVRRPVTVSCAIFLVCSRLVPVMTGEESGTKRAAALTNSGFDPSTALQSRNDDTPAAVLKEFKDPGATATAHVLTSRYRFADNPG